MQGIARSLIRGSVAAATAGTLALGATGAVSTRAQEANGIALRGYPLAIHQGTCQTLVAEPAYDLGLLMPRPLVVAGEEEGVFDDAYTADEFYEDAEAEELTEETEFLFDDGDGDGALDYGLDLDGDGALTDAELLERPILWTGGGGFDEFEEIEEADDAELADLRDTPHAVVIHRGSITDTDFLGCAEIEGAVDDEGELMAAVRPVGQNGFTGIAWFEEGEDGFLGIGGEGGEVEVAVFPGQVAQAGGEVTTEPAS